MISKIFLKDLINKKRVVRYLIILLSFTIIMKQYSSTINQSLINEKSVIFVTAGVILTSILYVVHTYSLFEKVKSYLCLPISKKRLLLSFIFSLICISFLERLSFIIIIIFMCSKSPFLNSFLVIETSILFILGDVAYLIANNKRSKRYYLEIFLLLCMILSLFIKISLISIIKLMALYIVILLFYILKQDSFYIAILRFKKDALYKNNHVENYFLKVMLNEKIYIVNTVMILVMIGMVSFFIKENYVFWYIRWAISAVNTPTLTMLSSDLNIIRQGQMLPNKKYSIYSMYMKFLLRYFLSVNLLIFILDCILNRSLLLYDITMVLILSFIESMIGYFLEIKHPIVNYQTKQQLWKHPRKYIIPIVVFFISVIISMFFNI